MPTGAIAFTVTVRSWLKCGMVANTGSTVTLAKLSSGMSVPRADST